MTEWLLNEMKTMNCKRAKQDIALCAGRDLDERSEQQLHRHLATCPHCRDYWHRAQASVSVLQRAGEETPHGDPPGLWPRVQLAVRQLDVDRPVPSRWRLSQMWVPAAAVAALVLALVSIGQTLSRSETNEDGLTIGTNEEYRLEPGVNGERTPIAPVGAESPRAVRPRPDRK